MARKIKVPAVVLDRLANVQQMLDREATLARTRVRPDRLVQVIRASAETLQSVRADLVPEPEHIPAPPATPPADAASEPVSPTEPGSDPLAGIWVTALFTSPYHPAFPPIQLFGPRDIVALAAPETPDEFDLWFKRFPPFESNRPPLGSKEWQHRFQWYLLGLSAIRTERLKPLPRKPTLSERFAQAIVRTF